MSKSRHHKHETGNKHPIDEMLRFQYKWVREFTVEHSDVWNIIGSNIDIAQMTQLAVGHQPNQSMIEIHRLVMWQTVLDYQIQSVILILQHKLDSGLALLRMAAELSRDVHVIGSDETRMNLWMEKEEKKREYQGTFKFDKSLPQAQIVYDTYKFCSTFGIHGHSTNNMYSELIGRVGKDRQFALLDISTIGILEAIGIWLLSFAPMHHLCAKEFFASRSTDLVQECSLWREFELSSTNLAQSYYASLKELKQEATILSNET